jgi:hypothetical protein
MARSEGPRLIFGAYPRGSQRTVSSRFNLAPANNEASRFVTQGILGTDAGAWEHRGWKARRER